MTDSSSFCLVSFIKIINRNNSKINDRLRSYLRQWLVSLIPIISTIVTGMTMGYGAVLLPQFQSINGFGNVLGFNRSLTRDSVSLTFTSTNEESWTAASSILAMVSGCWLFSILMDKFGSKITFVLINSIFILS